MNLVPLYEEAIQFNDYNGTVLAAGKVEVWYLGRTRLADIYSDVAGEVPLPNPFNLNDLGMQEVYVNPAFNYTLVVYDAYNSELFSVDKYIQGAGDHNTSNVVVQPSEHIGVSAWTVGDVQIYQPYIQGELGKTYHGIEPIVVNNQENKISARNIPLGVQEPLYFVEDSESACIIGMSGEYQPITGMSGYATTGDLADMAESISETYQPKGDYATVDDLSGFMEESKLETADGKITGYDGTAFAGGGSDEFIPWSASGNFATSGDLNDKLDTTAFSTVSGDFITAIPDSYASKDFVLSSVSSKLDSTAFSTVSGDFITALPEGLLNESGFEYDGDKISAYNGSAFVGQGGGELSGYELSAGNGISIENFPIEQKTVISVSGDYITKNSADTLYQPIGDYATTASVAEKLDTTAFSNVSGEFLTSVDLTPYQTTAGMTAYQEAGDYYSASNPSGFITGVDLSDYATTAEVADKQDITGMTAYATVESLTAKQDSGDYLSASDSANFLLTSDSGNFYPMNENPSGYLTAHQSLADYQTTAGMTAYQPVGDYLTTGDSANFYTTANESGYLTGIPETYLQNSDLTISEGKITEISGVPLSAGDELPESVSAATDYVTATSANIDSTIDNVSANSGAWGGSALPISAGPGIKFNIVDDTLVASTSGYVWQSALLFHTDTPITQTTYTLSDNCSNYDRLDVDFYDINNWRTVMECSIPTNLNASGTRGGYFSVVPASTATGANVWFKAFNWTAANTTWSCYCSEIAAQGGSTTQTVNANQPENPPKVVNIIGWKRVGGN